MEAAPAIVTATADVRVNLAIPHLFSAAHLCRKVGELEYANQGNDFGEFWHDILANASGALFTAVAAVESYANELFVDHEIIFPELKLEVMAKLWELYEQKPILEKFDFALLLKGATAFDRGSSPYQDVFIIIRLRNGLMHFKPEWFSAQEEHAKLSKVLAHRVTRCPFFAESEPLFPRGWTSHATVKWVIRSALGFMLEFENRSGIKPRIALFKDRFDAL
ncbi:MAG: hypothetical protein ABL860_10185 [Candidatus Nitrotoga sp.]